MDLVDETLSDWRRHPHQYGVNDCVLSAAAYFMRIGSLAQMPAFAGTYRDSDEAMVVMAAHGGMERLMEIVGGTLIDGKERSGRDLPTLAACTPERGDIVGLLADADYVLPGLCTGDRVVVRLERGTCEVPLKLVQWRGVWRGLPKQGVR